MRRVVFSVPLACGVLAASLGLVGVSLIVAPAPVVAAGKKVCTISDERLVELSGLIATENGYVVINDGSTVASRERVFFLDGKCKVTKAVQYGGNGPRDPEDLAISADGQTLWIADTGDNVTSDDRRDSVALWSMPISGESRPVLHRLAYPQGKAQDAEALLIGDDGTPYVITKTIGKAEIYRPTGPLRKNNSDPLPMEKVGEISLPATTTANRFGPAGRVTITGAARSPDGKRVVLRTYADAFEWDVPDGDLVKALTTGKPRVTALADPFGEAIAYTPDGTTFLTVSDVGALNEDVEVTILSYVPTKQEATKGGAASGGGQAQQDDGQSWLDRLTLDQITYLIAGVGVLGVLLVAVGVVGIVRSRRRPVGGEAASSGDVESDEEPSSVSARSVPVATAAVRPAPAGSGPVRGTTYGAPAAGPAAPPRPQGAVYGSGGGSGAVYGGAAGGRGPQGGVYGAGAAGGAPRGARAERGARPDRGGPGGGYGGPGPHGGSGVYGGGHRPEGQMPRAGRPPRGYPDEPGGPRGRGGPPVEPRHFDNDYGHR